MDRTTVPSSSTRRGARGSSGLALRWISPSWSKPLTGLGGELGLLGRGEDCIVQLPGKETSRHHAELRREGPVAVVRDCGSTNGVHVNGERVAEAPLERGDVLRLGEWIAVVVEGAAHDAVVQPFAQLSDGLYAGPKLQAVLEPARRVAQSDLPVVVVGETGTGKERVARAIHEWSGRKGDFVGVNCAALPEALAEAELFGYRKGAFTGAERAGEGYFRAANGGTLLLDEVTDLPLVLQAKLLRALEERAVQPLGEPRPVPIDVRIVAAAQEKLGNAVTAGRFRADLHARLDGLTLILPPLRQRREEVPYLFTMLLSRHSGGHPPVVEPRLIEQLLLYDLPFNVRELDLLARRLLVLHAHEGTLKRSHLPEHFRSSDEPLTELMADEPTVDEEPTFEMLLDALRAHGGVVAKAARALGITRQRAYRLMEAHGGVDLERLRGGGSKR